MEHPTLEIGEHLDRLISNEELAKLCGVSLATVRKWRHERTGPPGIRLGKHVRYRASAVEQWIEEHEDPWSDRY